MIIQKPTKQILVKSQKNITKHQKLRTECFIKVVPIMQKQEQIFFVDEVLFSTRQSNTSDG